MPMWTEKATLSFSAMLEWTLQRGESLEERVVKNAFNVVACRNLKMDYENYSVNAENITLAGEDDVVVSFKVESLE